MKQLINARSLVMDRIAGSGLGATTMQNAIRLLGTVNPADGYTCLTRQQLRDLFDVTNTSSARRHLGTLQAAGLIHYSTDRFDHFHIAFLLWPGSGITLATTTPER